MKTSFKVAQYPAEALEFDSVWKKLPSDFNFKYLMVVNVSNDLKVWKFNKCLIFTGKYLSEALILASTNPQYDNIV